jgi:hypothetical protein
MGSLGVSSEAAQIVDAIVDGNPARVSAADLEDLLQWTAAPENPRAEPMSGKLRARGIEGEQARSMALALIEQVLFAARDAAPHRVLGLDPNAPRKAWRDRYRLLMRIYHPDRATGDGDWLHERSTWINEAYRRFHAPTAQVVTRPIAPSPVRPIVRPRSRHRRSRRRRRALRRRLGSVGAVRRRAIVALIGIGSACVVYAFVANRSWERPSSELGPAAVVRTSP